ncbi:MAG: ATP-binding protein [Candidatus Aminicenantaceae bacterium]
MLEMNDILKNFTKRFKVPQKLRKYIIKIFSEDEIIILNLLSEREERISSITAGFPGVKSSTLKSLFRKGYLLRRMKESEQYYESNTFDQIIKRFVNHDQKYLKLNDKEKILFQDYVAELYLERMRGSHKPVYRVIPIGQVIQDKRQLIPQFQAIYYLQKATVLSVIDCICRTTFNRCGKPRRVCLALGEQAKFFIERGIGEEVDTRRGLEILRISEENGLVHSVDNRKDPNFLCNCCECCCVFVQGLKKHGIFTSIGKSGFVASKDSKKCDQCGICIEKCIFEAISYENEHIKIDQGKCFGCGLCAFNCSQQAIKLILEHSA